MSAPLQPSPKRILDEYLSGNAAVTALCPAGNISANKVTAGTCIRFTLIPGGSIVLRRYIVQHRFQVDVFAPTWDEVGLLCRTAQAELADDAFLGMQSSGGVVAAVDVLAAHDEPDDLNPGGETPRQLFDLLLTVKAV